MPLKIKIKWHTPLELKKSGTYYSADIECVPDTYGVYIFARVHGDNYEPIYIGETENLYRRFKQHLDSVKKMKAISEAPNGKKIIIYGTLENSKSEDISRKKIKIVQNALIENALFQGYELQNIQGTKFPTHAIKFSGKRQGHKLVGEREMLVRAK